MFQKLLITGSEVDANPATWDEDTVKQSIKVDLSSPEYKMTVVSIHIDRNHENVATTSFMELHDGIQVRVKGNILENSNFVLRDLDYEV